MQPRKPFGKRLEVPTAPPPAVRPVREVPEVDLRESTRKRVLHRGKLSFGQNGAFTIDCVIHDVSGGGARIQIEPGTELPAEVILVYLREHAAYEATVAWRRRGSVGLKFVTRHDLNAPTTPELEVLRQFCAESDLRPATAIAT